MEAGVGSSSNGALKTHGMAVVRRGTLEGQCGNLTIEKDWFWNTGVVSASIFISWDIQQKFCVRTTYAISCAVYTCTFCNLEPYIAL